MTKNLQTQKAQTARSRRWWEKKSLDEIIGEHIADHRLRLLDAEYHVEKAVANRDATRAAVDRLVAYRRQLRWAEYEVDPAEIARRNLVERPILAEEAA
jgi:hypothetical protein